MGKITKAGQVIPTGGAGTALAFDAEQFDTCGDHSTVTNLTRFTVSTAGKYFLSAESFCTSTSAISTSLALYVNGSQARVQADGQVNEVNDFLGSAAADYVEAYVTHTFGANATFTGSLKWAWLGS